MHSISVSVRLIALLAVAIVAVLAFASLSPGTRNEASAANPAVTFTVVNMHDVNADELVVVFKGAADLQNAAIVQNPSGCATPTSIGAATSTVTIVWPTKCVAKFGIVQFSVQSAGKSDFFVTQVTWKNTGVALEDDNLTGVTCTDVYLDRPPFTPKGDPPDATTELVAKSLNRIEPSQDPNKANGYDITTVTYLGPDLKLNDEPVLDPLDVVPDKPPTLLPCDDKRTNAKDGPEKNQMNANTPFDPISNYRVTATANLVKKDGQVSFRYSTCVFSEVNKKWVRTDVNNIIKDTGKQSVNYGTAILHLGTNGPTGDNAIDVDGDGKPDVADDPSECTDREIGLGQDQMIIFQNVLVSYGRNPTTDHPEQVKNIALNIPIDQDGAVVDGCTAHDLTNQKTKFEAECQDGSVGGENPNFVADDWDGDGCPDWDELDKDFINGRDPFNPNDCNLDNFTGTYSALATVVAAQDGTPGSYFHAIIAIEHNKTTDALAGALTVYLDSALLDAGGPPTTVPSGIDGNPGPPPPPPYTTSAPNAVNGTFDDDNQLLIFDFCVANIGGLFAPNAIAHAEVNAHTLKGTIDISGGQTQAACALKTRNTTSGIQLPPVDLVLVRQGINANHDKDKCTDMEELLGTGPATCGDDPYNPHDSDENFSSVGNLLVTVCAPPGLPTGICGADWDKSAPADFEIIPGAYFNCITDIQHDKSDNSLVARAFCYIDSTSTQINPEAYPGEFGDGIAGAGPPFPSTAAQPGGVWADVEPNVFTLTGAYDPVAHTLHLEGCFADKDGAGALGNIYTVATVDSGTGQGTVEITILIPTVADCQDGPPFKSNGPGESVAFPLSDVALVEQATKEGNGAGYDTDRDGCSDKEELGDNQVLGGLRDPYKYWDFYDPNQNRAIGFTDFLALVARSGTVDFGATAPINRYTDPLTFAPDGIYHPRFDRGGQQTGANSWNENPPNGAIGFTDFLSLVRQSGHTCGLPPNDPKYPYLVS